LDTPSFNSNLIAFKSTSQIHYWIVQLTELLESMISFQLSLASFFIPFIRFLVIIIGILVAKNHTLFPKAEIPTLYKSIHASKVSN